MREINLDEFWNKRYPHGKLPKYAKEIAVDFAKEILELATENAKIKGFISYSGDEESYIEVDKQSILDTINKIK